jgi:putative membrane protein
MSMRQFTPRKFVRRNTSPFLSLPIFIFLGLTIAMQIAYPLVDGFALDFITLASVYTAATAMFLHGFAVYGARY